MAGYPHGSGYPPYGAPPPQPYGAPSAPYAHAGEKPPKEGKQDAYGSAAAPPAGYGYSPDPYAHGGEKPPKEGKQSGYGSAPPAGYGYGPDPYAHGGEKPPKEGKQSGYGSAPPAGYGHGPDPYAHGGEKPPKEGKQSGYGSSPSAGHGYGSDPYAHTGGKPPKEGKQSGYGYDSAPPSGYGSAPPAGHGSAPPSSYGSAPPSGYGSAPPSGYGSAPPSGYGSAPPSGYGLAPPAYGNNSPFAALMPSSFPPGTDPNVVACFQSSDMDGSGFIDDKELQRALSSYNQSFSLRTVHLMMYLFTSSNVRKIGPKEFTSVFYSLQNWRAIFEKSDHDRSGKIDINELREALLSIGFAVSPVVLDLLVSKFDKSGGKSKSIEYDHFIECCLTVKGLTEKFKEKDMNYSGSATFSYESFMLTVLPFLIA